jgi:hypothetical protein
MFPNRQRWGGVRRSVRTALFAAISDTPFPRMYLDNSNDGAKDTRIPRPLQFGGLLNNGDAW